MPIEQELIEVPRRLAETKHFQLFRRLRKQVLEAAPREKIPTIEEMVRDFAVSRGTVEQALNRLRSEGLIYRPAGRQRYIVAPVRDDAVHRVALIRPDYPSPDYEAICRTVVEAGKKRKWTFDLVSYRTLEGLELSRAVGSSEGAFLLAEADEFPEHIVKALLRPLKPKVILQEHVGAEVRSVALSDQAEVGRIAVRHLAELGHRRIALLYSEPRAGWSEGRAAGWRQAMTELGETNLEELVIDCGIDFFDPAIDVTYKYFSNWLDRPHPSITAVYCVSAAGAMAVFRALRERNIDVPREISVISYGAEFEWGPYLSPPLTAIEMDMAEYGEQAVVLMDEALSRPDLPARQVRLEPYLVVRESTDVVPRSGMRGAAPRPARRFRRRSLSQV